MYAPRVPQGPSNGARAVSIFQAGQRVEDATLETVGEKHTAAGARIAPKELTVARVTGTTITIHVRTDGTAENVYVALDAGGIGLGGAVVVTGSPEGLFDGYVPMEAAGTAGDGDLEWQLGPIDTTMWPEGVHVLKARAERVAESGAPVFNTFVAPFVVDRGGGVVPPLAPIDRDGDGVPTSQDDCPTIYDPDQADFDGDGVGDLCDYCPTGGASPMLDADGCRALTQDQRDRVDSAVMQVLNDDGDATVLVQAVDGANP
jgi:hypothetical protein